MDAVVTTLARIRAHRPCEDGWRKLLRHLGKTRADDEPLPLLTVLDSNGLDDCLWCLRAVKGVESFARHLAVDFAERVRHLMTDERSHQALDVARRHADGLASDDELAAAWDSARAASRDAAGDAAWAAWAAWAAVWAASRDASRDAAWAAWDAAWEAEHEWQTNHLRAALLDPAAYLASKRSEVTA